MGSWNSLTIFRKHPLILGMLLLCLFQTTTSWAQQDDLLSKKVSIYLESMPLEDALDTLAQRNNCYFTFNSNILNVEKKVGIQANEMPFRVLLNQLLSDSTLSFEVVKKQVVIRKRDPLSGTLKVQNNAENIQVKGSIVDAYSAQVLPFANVGILHKHNGTTTNADGRFNLEVTPSLMSDTLMVSYLGYENLKVSVVELLIADTLLRLIPTHISLQEVIVRTREPLALIRNAMENAASNYCVKPAKYSTFYREWVKKNRHYTMYMESMLEVSKPRYVNGVIPNDAARLLKSRKIYDRSRLDTVSFKLQGGVDACLRLDIIRHPPDFLLEEMFRYYNYTFQDIELYNNRPVYVINCKPKPTVREPMLEADVFIEANTMSIVRVDFGYPPEMAEKLARTLVTKKSRGVRAKPAELNYSIRYRLSNGRYFFSHTSGQLKYKVRSRRRLFFNTFDIRFEMATTAIDTTEVHRIGYRDRLSSRAIMSEISGEYDPSFWGQQTFVEPEKDIKDAIRRIENATTEIREQ